MLACDRGVRSGLPLQLLLSRLPAITAAVVSIAGVAATCTSHHCSCYFELPMPSNLLVASQCGDLLLLRLLVCKRCLRKPLLFQSVRPDCCPPKVRVRLLALICARQGYAQQAFLEGAALVLVPLVKGAGQCVCFDLVGRCVCLISLQAHAHVCDVV